MPGITSKLPEGWERSETNTGIPYYINHENEITQWDHPEMVSLMEEIDVSSKIKYAAYRTAVKLRAIQKKTQLYMVTLSVIIQSLDEEGIRDGFVEGNLSVAELLRVITTIFTNQNRNSANNVDVSRGSELVLNWLLNVYDPGRTGFVQILSVKVGLSVLCTAKVQDKYRYMFKQLCIGQKYLDRRKLKLFLQEMLEIPKFIYESAAFSGSSVEPAVRNCFERVSIPEGVSAEEFIEWMTAEPQTIVWLPTLHRLAVSETVKHEAKCNVCKDYPIVGFRYRCLKCFNFDICQECFWSGGVNKQHKISHPTQEYCLVSTQKEDIKDFTKVLRNKVSKKKKRKQEHPSKGRYIPIGIEDAVPSDADEDDSVDAPVSTKVFPGTHDKLGSYAARLADHESMEDEDESKEATPLPRPSMDDEHHLIRRYANRLSGDMDEASPYSSQLSRPVDSKEKRDLEDLITDLEDDNRALLGEIANIHDSRRHNDAERVNISDGDSAEATFLREQRERLEAREEVLEAHNHQLQVQLHRLRILLQQEETTLSGLIQDEEKMAALLASERVKQLSSQAKKKARTGDMSQISALMKSHQTSPPLTSHTTAAPPTTSLQPSRNPGTSAENASSGVYQPTSFMGSPPSYPVGSLTPVSRHTFPAPGSATAMQAYPPQYSLPPSVLPPRRDVSWQPQSGDVRGAAPNTKIPLGSPVGVSMLPPRRDVSWQPQSGDVRGASPNTNVPMGSPMDVSVFAPKTAAELGLLDRPDSSFEEMEMNRIVDRMTAAFPLDVHSDMPVDVHNDLFLAAGLIGESLQSMVTTVSRATGPRKGAMESRRSYERDLDEPRYGQDNLGYGDWPRTDPEGANRFSTHSSTGSEYGPL